MAAYTYEYRDRSASFPNTVPDVVTYKDVDADVAPVVGQIESAVRSGDYATATQLISDYEANLTDKTKSLKYYLISAEDINRIIEDIRNTQIFAISNAQSIYTTESEPVAQAVGDVWVGGK